MVSAISSGSICRRVQMILGVMSTYASIAQLLRRRLEESRTERVMDLCSGAGGAYTKERFRG
jgi:hypothetical protein